MKKLITLLVLVSGVCFATENQLEYMYGRGNPRSSIDVGNGSSQEGSNGSEWLAQILHQRSSRFYLGLGGGQFHSEDNVSMSFVPQATSTINSRMNTVMALARMNLNGNPKAMTYLMAGAGWVHHSLSVTAVPASTWSDTGTSERRTIVDGSADTFGYAGGIGLDFAINDRLYIGLEARYQGSLKERFAMTPEGAAATSQTGISVPLNVFFGGLKAGIKY